MGTLFASVYNRFLGKITDDMYMELTPQDTIRDLQNLLIDAIPGFEFPRIKLDYKIIVNEIMPGRAAGAYGFMITNPNGSMFMDSSYFEMELTSEEINILAILMMAGWLQRQITSIEHIRMKYSGTDFKMTSQANHLAKLLTLSTEVCRQSLHAQRLYKRRKVDDNGYIRSNWSVLAENSAIDGYVGTSSPTGPSSPEEDISEIIYDGGLL